MTHAQSEMSRRRFLAAMAGASAALLWPTNGRAADEVDPRVAKIVADSIGVDMHNHVDVPLTSGAAVPDIDLAGEMKRSGLSAICMTFAVDYQPLTAVGQAYDRFLNGLTAMDADLDKNHMKRALTLADLHAAHDAGQPTVIQDVEGGHFLEGHLDRLEVAYKRGLRVLGLLHDHDADPPLGDLYTAPAHLAGLTSLGADVIRECDRLGIVVDLTHASQATVAAALKVSTKPLLFSHTGLDTQLGSDRFMAQMMRQRLIGKAHAKAMADAGAVIGVWTHLAGTVVEYVQNVRAMVDVVGVDHVGIGTDTKLTQPYGGPGGRPGVGPASRGSGGPGGGPDGPGGDRRGRPGVGRNRGGDRTNTAWPDLTGGFYHGVVGQMLKQGFTPDEIGKIGGGNFCRVFGDVTAGHT